jgi:hypothetical protein
MNRRAFRKWCSRAAPILASLMRSEDSVLSRLGGPPAALTACLDQLEAAWCEAEDWLYDHPCPDSKSVAQSDALVRSCGGIWAIASTYLAVADDPENKDRVDDYLKGRIAVSEEARAYLGQCGIK